MSRRIADLLIKIGADSYEFQQKVTQVEKGLGSLEKKLTSLGKNLSLKVTAPLTALGVVSLKNADYQLKAEAKVQQALKVTGGAVGLNFRQLADYASELQGKTLFGDDTILNESTAKLLSFTNIAGDNFKRTQKLALDLSTALKMDLGSATLQLGKALSDPVTKLSSLSRTGITFTEQQTEMIKAMAKSGDVAKAQTMILDELEKRFGDQAAAAAEVGLGAVQQLSNSWGDFLEQLATIMMPLLARLAKSLSGVVAALQRMSPTMQKVLVITGALAAAAGPICLSVGTIVKMLPSLAIGVKALMSPIGAVSAAVMALGAAFIYAKNRKEELFEEKVNKFQGLTTGTLERNLAENRRLQAVNDNESPFQGNSPYSKLVYALDKPSRMRKLKEDEKAMVEALARQKKAEEEYIQMETERVAVQAQIDGAMEMMGRTMDENSDKMTSQGGIINDLTSRIQELERKKLLPATTVEEIARYNDEIAKLKEELQRIQSLSSADLAPRQEVAPLEKLPPIEAPALEVKPLELKPVINKYSSQMQELYATVRDGIFGWADDTSGYLDRNLGDTVRIVKNYTDALTEKGWNFSAALEEVSRKVSGAMERFGQMVSQFLADSIVAVAESFGQMLAGELGFEGVMRSILSQFAGFLKTIGAQLIEFGVMVVAFKTTLKSVLANPWAAIAVGAAMVTAAAIMTALINKSAKENVPALASGGLAFGKTYAMVGDNPNAAIDPEVIAPLSKLQKLFPEKGAGGNINLTISGKMTASGRDLSYIFKKEDFKNTVLGR